MCVPGSTMPASFPPSSSVTRLTPAAAPRMIFLPVATDPVNTILSIPALVREVRAELRACQRRS